MRSFATGVLLALVGITPAVRAQSTARQLPTPSVTAPGVSSAVSDDSRSPPNTVTPPQQFVVQAAQAPAVSPANLVPYEAPQPSERVWYGWQTLAADGASLALFTLAFADAKSPASSSLAVGGLVAYIIGGPIVHAHHGHGGKTVGSLAFRLGLPLGGALLGAAIGQPCRGELGCVGQGALGAAIGIAGAVAIDAALLANEDRPAEHALATPFVTVDSKSACVGVAGRF
jgi:hypothetical protein